MRIHPAGSTRKKVYLKPGSPPGKPVRLRPVRTKPAAAKPLILAISGNDTSSTFADTTTGNFLIRGLSEETYSLEFHPVEGYKDTTLTDIAVFAGQTTLLDTLTIH